MEQVLSVENPRREFDVVSSRSHDTLYWGNSGFVFGPGFKAWAKDFPEGTRLRITAEIIPPEPVS